MNLPDYNFLPAPMWLLTVLHIVTLTLHFLAMNFMLGGILVVLFGRFEDRWNDPTVKSFVQLFPSAMAATVTFGVAPLLFLQVVYHRQVYAAAIVSGWLWLWITFAAIISYYFLYAAAFTRKENAGTRKAVFLSLSLIGLLYISVIYSSVFSMAENPELPATLYAGKQNGYVLNPEIGSWIFRWLHMVLGAVTVGGFFVGLIGRNNEPAWRVGRTSYLYGMVAASIAGVIYLMTLGDILKPFMRTPGIWFLTAGIILSYASLHFFFKRNFLVSGLMLFVSLVGMVVARHVVRLLHLGESLEMAPIKPQWDVFGLFLVCFLGAIAIIAWMLRLYFRGKGEGAAA